MKTMTRPTPLLVFLSLLFPALLTGCASEEMSDAFGNFEATEVRVSAEARGRLLAFDVHEGSRLTTGQPIGLIDTTAIALQRQSLMAQRRSVEAQRAATMSQIAEVNAQKEVLQVQLDTAMKERDRTQRLYENKAATDRERTQREAEVTLIMRQRDQADSRIASIRAQANSISAQVRQLDAQIAEADARMQDAMIVNPAVGTVLTVVARQGELVQPGSPLYTIADISTLTMKAFATGDQLPDLRLGSTVDVLVDDGQGGIQTLTGTVSWIASRAQFTPTPIQTRDERAELVYAFEVDVANPDGLLKIGMPGEVNFQP